MKYSFWVLISDFCIFSQKIIPFSKKIFLFFRTKNHDFARNHEITISCKNIFRDFVITKSRIRARNHDFVLRVSNSDNYYHKTKALSMNGPNDRILEHELEMDGIVSANSNRHPYWYTKGRKWNCGK